MSPVRPAARVARLLPLLVILLWASADSCPAQNAVEYRGHVYVRLSNLLDSEFLDGKSELTNLGRVIETTTSGSQVHFTEGGDRVLLNGTTTVALQSPVLVLDGSHYIPAQECAPFFGYIYEPGPPPSLHSNGRELPLYAEPLDAAFFRAQVEDLRPVRRPVVLTRELSALHHLNPETSSPETLPPGTALLVRREVRLNGIPYVLATRNDETLETYILESASLSGAAQESSLQGTHLERVFQNLSRLAETSTSINHGPRRDLSRTVSLTADLCWSLRSYEKGLFEFLPRLARVEGQVWITLFMTGRWLQQHPGEMQKLIEMSRAPGVGVVWGLHSWVHPKLEPFMDAYSPDEVRADALRLEHDLLEWGIVPSLFYRFPGLVHDKERLHAILALDLISVDCDSWVTGMRFGRPPHRLEPRDGSILLIHGNGNEATGIPLLYEWLLEHPGWRLGALPRFISATAQEISETTGTASFRERSGGRSRWGSRGFRR